LALAQSVISFRLGLTDAEMLAAEFYPFFSARDLINLPNYHIYLKLMIDGVVSQPFSGVTFKRCGRVAYSAVSQSVIRNNSVSCR
jgi:hypothetical protein